MSNAKRKPTNKSAGIVTKSISLPAELFQQADNKVQREPEANWSLYVRRLIRKDLNKEPLAA